MEDGTSSKSSSGKKPIIIAVVLALLVAGGVAYYFLNKDSDSEQTNTETSSVSEDTQQQSAANNEFEAAATAGEPFVATVSTTTNGGQQVNGVMSSDGKGNVSYVYKADGKDVSLIYTADAYYLCSGTATCIKYPASQSGTSGFNPSDYQYDASKLGSLKDTAAYKGQQNCPSPATGTCDVWSVTNGGTTSTMYVNSSSKRIAKVTTTSGTTTSDITYEYKNVTVAAPANSVTLPTQ